MILKSFSYATRDWKLDHIYLGKANLIVGKNSSGKSKALSALARVLALLSQKTRIGESEDMDTVLVLADADDTVEISVRVEDRRIAYESLILNGVSVVERTESTANMSGESLYPPSDMLLMHVRRDMHQYPVIEKIIKWSDQAVVRNFINQNSPSKKELYDMVSGFSSEQKNDLLVMANNVGFPLTMFDTFENAMIEEFPSIPSNLRTNFNKLKLILVKEVGLETVLYLDNLSSGMYRTLMLLVLIEQLAALDYPALIAIDDLGEGLDYSRAPRVGRMLFDVCTTTGIQLIVASNEEFMMNVVDMSQWNILVRHKGTVKSLTSDACPEEFEEFKFLGLSNYSRR